MGAVNFSIDPQLITTLKNNLPLTIFVETGTFRGDTIELIANQFDNIYSVELSEKYYQDAVARFKGNSKVTLFHDTSPASLAAIMPQIQDQSTVFWLDAHWCVANSTEGEASQCPLLDELHTIKQLNQNSVIIIDDARLFLTTPPAPHEISDWPNFDTIVKALYQLSAHHQLAVINDCILFYPASIEREIAQFAYKHGTDWLQIMDKSRDYNQLLDQLNEKDALIQLLDKACKERQVIIDDLMNNQANRQTNNQINIEANLVTPTPRKKKFFII
ncbi:MAG: hypothetical protein ACYC0J_00135 [Gammaproteobacteria bacterium]